MEEGGHKLKFFRHSSLEFGVCLIDTEEHRARKLRSRCMLVAQAQQHDSGRLDGHLEAGRRSYPGLALSVLTLSANVLSMMIRPV